MRHHLPYSFMHGITGMALDGKSVAPYAWREDHGPLCSGSASCMRDPQTEHLTRAENTFGSSHRTTTNRPVRTVETAWDQ